MKKVLYAGLIIVAGWLLFVWIEFVSLPYIEARKMNAEIMSKRILWPVNEEYGHVNVPFVNGRTLVFNQSVGRKKLLRIVEADGRVYDVVLPEGRRGLYGTFRDSKSTPIVAIWDTPFDLLEIGKYWPDTIFEIKVVEIQQDGHIKTETIKSDYFIGVSCVGDNWLLGSVFEDVKGESVRVPVLVSLKDLKILDLPLRDGSIYQPIIAKNTIVYDIGLSGQRNLYAYPLSDKSTKIIGEVFDPHVFPIGWTMNDSVLAWADRRRNGSYDIYYYNFSQNKGGLLVGGESSQDFPFLYEDYLFWSDDRNANETGYDIYVKNLRTGDVKVLVNAPGDQLYPVYFHGYLYWTNNIYSNLADMWIYSEQPYVFRKKVELP